MTKFGAILATGIIDAGGRNVVLSLRSRAGYNKTAAIVGVTLWTHYWYWYPMMHMLSLAFEPTAIVGLNKDLKRPKNFEFRSNARPSLFAYVVF